MPAVGRWGQRTLRHTRHQSAFEQGSWLHGRKVNELDLCRLRIPLLACQATDRPRALLKALDLVREPRAILGLQLHHRLRELLLCCREWFQRRALLVDADADQTGQSENRQLVARPPARGQQRRCFRDLGGLRTVERFDPVTECGRNCDRILPAIPVHAAELELFLGWFECQVA